jgi:heme/copper-type cytochrome/quinol oxidase subunit 2
MGSEWILGRLAWGCGLDSTGSGQGPAAGCCECGDEPSGSCATELLLLLLLVVVVVVVVVLVVVVVVFIKLSRR